METFFNELSRTILEYYESLVYILPNLVLAFIVLFIAYFISNAIRNLVSKLIAPQMDDALLAGYLGSTAKVLIFSVAILISLNLIGLGKLAGGLMAGAGLGAFIIGFAFKDIGENFLAGIMLAFHRPFRVGDTVELNNKIGTVVSLNLRTSHIKTFDGKDIFIPNANVIKFPVVNYTIDGFLRQTFTFQVSYGVSLKEVEEAIQEELQLINGILKVNKLPFMGVNTLKFKKIELSVNYWINTFDSEYSSGAIKIQAVNNILARMENDKIDIF